MSVNGTVEAARHGIARSPHWPTVEHHHKIMEPLCRCCHKGEPSVGIQVHHIFPFHYCIALGRPDLELDQRNLVSLCEHEVGRPCDNHHLLIGHLRDFKSSNIHVLTDCTSYDSRSEASIIIDSLYLMKEAARLVPLDEMTSADKQAFITLMNTTYPLVIK